MNEISAIIEGENYNVYCTATKDKDKWDLLITMKKDDDKIELEFDNMTMREVLNKISHYKNGKRLQELHIKCPPYYMNLHPNPIINDVLILRIVYINSRNDDWTMMLRYTSYSSAMRRIKKELGI